MVTDIFALGMQGELVAEAKGRDLGRRINYSEPDGQSRIEITSEITGTLLGLEFSALETTLLHPREKGYGHGVGHAVGKTKEGDPFTWDTYGMGRPLGRGQARSARGCSFIQSKSEKLSRLNTMVLIWEAETDENGQRSSKVWEWK